MKNQILLRDDLYSFDFFTEAAFHKEQAINYIIDIYMELAEENDDDYVLSSGRLSHAAVGLFKLGVFGRVYNAGERYGSPFMGDLSPYIYDLGEEFNGDLIKMVNAFDERYAMFPMENEETKLFQHDISKALEMRNMFYLNSEIDYGLLFYFTKEFDPYPLSKDIKKKLFRNVPIQEVW